MGSGGAYPTTSSNYGLAAPINLPHGATITNIRFIYVDNSTNNLTLLVGAHHIASGFYTFLAQHTTSVQTPTVQTVDVSPSTPWTVDNSADSLAVYAFPSSTWTDLSMMVRGVIVTYTMPRPAR